MIRYNMSRIRFIILMCFFIGFLSCSDRVISNNEVDEFISKYNDEKFSELNNISIAQRSKSVSEIVYVIGRYGGNLPVYFVTFDLGKQSITDINNSNLVKSNTIDYLSKDEIIALINAFRKYNFYLLAVDSIGNAYINPFYSNQPPFLLRLKVSTGDNVVKKGYVYELYKDNWYLNKTK